MAGRPFAAHDAAARVAMVNETLGRRLFQARDPLRNQIWIGQTPYDVIGVVADYTTNPLRYPEFDPKIHLPLPAQWKELTRVTFLVRADGDPAPLTQTIRREVRGVQAFVIPVLVVLAIGAIATWVPSRRALRINPADLLRTT